MRELWRICGWGVSAAASLVIAVLAVSTDAGYERARYAARQLREIVAPTGVPVRGDTFASCRWNGKALSLAIE